VTSAHSPIRCSRCGWDILVVAAFSLVIYFWAIAVALPAEQIQGMVNQVVVPEEADLH
jgi:hypothetical protein